MDDVEFYHGTGGVTWSERKMLDNNAKYACGNHRRELVDGTFRAHPIKDYGAITQGTHRFCQITTGLCDGLAEFITIWTHQDGRWLMARVPSYGHRSAEAEEFHQ